MKVLKFGGTSVGSSEAIKKVLGIVLEQMKTQKLVVVVSALGGTTDKLLNAGNVILYFMEAVTMKRAKMPDDLEKKLKGYF